MARTRKASTEITISYQKPKPIMGRPKKEFDQKLFENLCKIGSTETEIEAVMEISVDTINNRCKELFGQTFADTRKQLAEHAKVSVRRAQLHLAQKNAGMAIWLGKQMLGQKDIRTLESTEDVQDLFDLDRALGKRVKPQNV